MALVAAGAVLYALWSRGVFLPGWIQWHDREISDDSGTYEITLAQKRVAVRQGGREIWASPEGVKVQDVLSCDIDGDQAQELVVLCWKIGRYGKHRPFWVEKDEKKWSQHLFVYEYMDGEIRPKWMSSYMGVDVAELAEAAGKGLRECRLLLTDPKGEASCWRWDSWGFAREELSVSFVVFGDNLIHEPLYRYGLNNGRDFDFLYENIRENIADSDVAVLNQETPLTDDPAMYGDYPRFGTPVEVGQAIVDAGFHVVTCATNHALDRGTEGLEFTKGFFQDNHILCLGTREEGEEVSYETITRNGIRFALFNYTYGTNGIVPPQGQPVPVYLLEEEEEIRTQIGRAREEADFVIVFAHWGTEGMEEPDAFQRRWAQVFLNSGVDVVVGTHPHALQPVEMLTGEDGRKMLVYYSIGNYISAQSEKSCVKGGMASFTVELTAQGCRVSEYDLRPLAIIWREGGRYEVDFAQPSVE